MIDPFHAYEQTIARLSAAAIAQDQRAYNAVRRDLTECVRAIEQTGRLFGAHDNLAARKILSPGGSERGPRTITIVCKMCEQSVTLERSCNGRHPSYCAACRAIADRRARDRANARACERHRARRAAAGAGR